MLADAYEGRKVASSMGFARERPEDGWAALSSESHTAGGSPDIKNTSGRPNHDFRMENASQR